MGIQLARWGKTFRANAKRLRRSRDGVAALEFALIAPLMILMFVGTLEVSAGVSVNRKVSRISSAISDLVTQSESLTGTDVNNIMDVAADIMRPHNETVKIRISGLAINSGQARVSWSCSSSWSSLPSGTIFPAPSGILIDGTFMVVTQVEVDYTPMVGWARYSATDGVSFDMTGVTMDEQMFLRPRAGNAVSVSC